MDLNYLVENSITSNEVYDLYNKGQIQVKVPKDVNPDSYAVACIELIQDIWGDPSVGISFEEKEFDYFIDGDLITIFVD